MVVIRLSRSGQKSTPVYKVMVQDKDAALSGRFIEQIGTLRLATIKKADAKKSDIAKRYVLELKADRYTHWVKLGAQPSARLAKWTKEFKVLANVEAPAAEAAAPAKAAKKAEAPKAKAAPAKSKSKK